MHQKFFGRTFNELYGSIFFFLKKRALLDYEFKINIIILIV